MRLKKTILLSAFALLFISCATNKDITTISEAKSQRLSKKYRTVGNMYEKAIEFYEGKRYDKALSLFNNIANDYSGHQRLDTIMFYTANCHYYNKDYYLSSDLYNTYRTNMGRGIFAELADLYYALSFYQISPDVELDQTFTRRAIAAFQDFMYRNPNHEMTEQSQKYIDELNERLYKNEVSVAQTYFNIGYFNSCIIVLRNILQDNPNTPYRENVMFMLVKSNFEYARTSIPEKRVERFYGAIDEFYKFTEEYPESKLMKDANKYHIQAKDITDGTAMINEVTGRVTGKNNELYKHRDKLEAQIKRYKKRNNEKKIKEATIKLDIVNIAIAKFELIVEKRKRETEINKIGA